MNTYVSVIDGQPKPLKDISIEPLARKFPHHTSIEIEQIRQFLKQEGLYR